MKDLVAFVVGFISFAFLFLAMDLLLFSARGLSFLYHG